MTDLSDPTAAAHAAATTINSNAGIESHDIALVLGSGWGGAADLLGETVAEISAAEVPGFHAPPSKATVRPCDRADRGQRQACARLGSRTHYYEGKGVRAVAHGVRTAAAAGCSSLVLTNGCGGLNRNWAPGTPVLISDHLNLTGTSPIEGANFVDLTDLYSPRMRAIAKEIDPTLDEGVYAQFRGPHYETPAEVRMAGILGADLVGMSTTLEAIAARQAGLELLGISLVTNLAAGIQETPLSHAEVIEAGAAAAPRISRLLADIVAKL